MDVVSEFLVGQEYTNDQIRFALAVENLGGIRPAIDSRGNLRHIAVLTTADEAGKSVAENPYHDRIEGNVLLYTAQGREGDQQLAGRNKRLTEQYLVPVPIYAFINVGRQTYRFLGLLELLRHYPEVQPDRRGTLRNVWLFEFLIHSEPSAVPIEHAGSITASILAESRSSNPLSELERQVTALPSEGGSPEVGTVGKIEEVRRQLLRIHPQRFEALVRAVMEANGFRDTRVTAVSGDGGIDIDAFVEESNDFFGGTHVQAQVKRWRHAVGSIEINKFRGALSTTAKGVFITTSSYTRAAVVEAHHPTKMCVSLIDGGRLASLVLRSGTDMGSFV